MSWRPRRLSLWLCGLMCVIPLTAAAQGRIDGTVSRSDGTGIGGVLVVIQETGAAEISGAGGRYAFDRVAPGTYTLRLSLGEYAATTKATVARGTPAKIGTIVNWPLAFSEDLTVTGASRHVERV